MTDSGASSRETTEIKGCDTCAWTESGYRGAYRNIQHGCGLCVMTFGPSNNKRGYEQTFPMWEPRKQEEVTAERGYNT